MATAAQTDASCPVVSDPGITISASEPAEQAHLRPPDLGTFGKESFIDQHPLRAARTLYSLQDATPRVLLAILAKQKEAFLPFYLECVEALDYPKSAIVLYIRTNNNTDATETILRDWLARVGHLYAHVEFDPTNVDVKVERFGAHEWNAQRFQVLGQIRNVSLQAAKTHGCDYYFVADVDNFIRPRTLRELVALRLPIVSPLLRSIVPSAFYSNYHAEVDANGYFRDCDQYQWILNRWIRGAVEVPVVHCTYLVRTDVIDQLTYLDGSSRYEYVVFSDSARKAGVPQYVDNRQVYGYITFGEGHAQHVLDGIDRVRRLFARASDTTPTLDQHKRASPEGHRSEAPQLHAFVINLDDRPDRWAEVSARCDATGLAVERFSAARHALGWIGCGESHVRCIQLARERQLPWVLVLEDDAYFTESSIKRFRELLPFLWANRDKWERFNGGPTLPAHPSLRVFDQHWKLLYAHGFTTHFTLVHSDAYEHFLKWDSRVHKAIDAYLFELETVSPRTFRSIATVPHVSTQVAGVSDVASEGQRIVFDYEHYFAFSEHALQETLSSYV